MNIWKLLPQIPRVIEDVRDLATRLLALHDDPEFKALIASSPGVKAQSDAISRDAREISEAFR